MNFTDKKQELKKLLTERSFKYSEEPIYNLASGIKSQYYIDCKMTTLYSRGMGLMGDIFLEMVSRQDIKGIGGLTLGADPLAYATAMAAYRKNIDLTAFVIRKNPKKHGLKKWIEGDVKENDRVIIVDDVITTGGSTIKAIDHAEDSGLKIVKVLVLVDRQEGGREAIIARGYGVDSVFTKSELKEQYDCLAR